MKKFQIKEERLNEASWDIKNYRQFKDMLWDIANKAGEYSANVNRIVGLYEGIIELIMEDLDKKGVVLDKSTMNSVMRRKDDANDLAKEFN